MLIFPAIDMRAGKPVRLYQGDFSTAHQVAGDVLETAQSFEKDGASWVHMVDLDGALAKKPVNTAPVLSVVQNTGLKVELGGGIRTMEDIDFYLSAGISRVILGSVALKEPEMVRTAVRKYGEKIAVGIDAKNGFVAAEGWVDGSNVYFTDLAVQMEKSGVENIIFTDISKDGTLAGPNFEQLSALQSAVHCRITASGGISCMDDLRRLCDMGLYAAICGKSIYSETVNLKEAVEVCEHA